MRGNSVIYIRWKLTGRIEIYSNLGKLYNNRKPEEIGISKSTLHKKNLFEGYQNNAVEIRKFYIFQ